MLEYLRALLETPGLLPSSVLLSFLEVPDSVRPMLFAASAHRGLSLLQSAYERGGGGGAGGQGAASAGGGADGAGFDRDGKDGTGGGGQGKGSYQHKTSAAQYANSQPCALIAASDRLCPCVHCSFEERKTLELVNALRLSTNKSEAGEATLNERRREATAHRLIASLSVCCRVSAIKSYEQWFFDQKPRQTWQQDAQTGS